MDTAYRYRQRLKAELKLAVENEALTLVYQPLIDLKTRRVVACEAGRSLGWEGLADAFLGIERFGESGPGPQVAKHLGLTPEALAALL